MFWNGNKLKKIHIKLQKQQITIDTYLRNMSNKKRNRLEWCTVHQRECMSTGLLMWEKDLEFRYTFLNDRHCNDFFKLSLADVRSVIGKTDSEAIVDFKKRTGLAHTFGDACIGTDAYTLEHNKKCRFWEIGYIGDKIFILDITKMPLIKNSKIVGTTGWALNQSVKECEINSLLEVFIGTGEAVRLNPYSDSTASYLITKTLNPFNGVFPK